MLEIKERRLTALEDPPGVVTIAGTGRTDVAGPVRFNGVAQRSTGDFTATLDADGHAGRPGPRFSASPPSLPTRPPRCGNCAASAQIRAVRRLPSRLRAAAHL